METNIVTAAGNREPLKPYLVGIGDTDYAYQEAFSHVLTELSRQYETKRLNREIYMSFLESVRPLIGHRLYDLYRLLEP